MMQKVVMIFISILILSHLVSAETRTTPNPRYSSLPGIPLILDHLGFNTVGTSSCDGSFAQQREGSGSSSNSSRSSDSDSSDDESGGSHAPPLKLDLKHRSSTVTVLSSLRDVFRINTFHRRIKQKQHEDGRLRRRRLMRSLKMQEEEEEEERSSEKMMMTSLESGFSQGSGEYFMDVYVGTPPRHMSLVLDTGSDLNWIQCLPCHDCFNQSQPYYDPTKSTSYTNITCADRRCSLVSSPDPHQPCHSDDQSCPYFYWYGDSSNTTGDFALETFTVNMTKGKEGKVRAVERVMFGCGHWNRGLFHGASGLLGLGRGPLSFASQLQSLYGHSFSYCLVDRNSDGNVSSKFVLGEDKSLIANPLLNFTSFLHGGGDEVVVDTFYYVGIKEIVVDDEILPIPPEIWELTSKGDGGTIIDSGTTLSYFAESAYQTIKRSLMTKIGNKYPIVKVLDGMLEPCYNISGIDAGGVEMPEFGIVFKDGGVWNFPAENYFVTMNDQVVCLAMLETPHSNLSILGNFIQQNFHVSYDIKRSRLGFLPTECSNL